MADFLGPMSDIPARLHYAGAQGGKSIIPGEETRTNTSYGTMPTPDIVSGIVLPTDGLIVVVFQGTYKATSGSAKAAIFVGANQLKAEAAGTQTAQEASVSASTAKALTSYDGGLRSGNTAYAGDVTTGQVVATDNGDTPIVGGPCYIFAAAGTYNVSVQFKSALGDVLVSARHLWVWTKEFPATGV